MLFHTQRTNARQDPKKRAGHFQNMQFNIIYIITHKEKRVAKERTGVGIVQIEKT